jgi:trans-2,3-dihydro-3-hydroxyanthranilate isomerase
MIKMQQPNPIFEAVFDNRPLAAEMLGLNESDLDDFPVQVVTCGVPFLFVPIKNLKAVQSIKVRPDKIEQALEGLAPRMVFVFTRETVNSTSTVHSRMFAHLNGIPEDPATGAASGPLGAYLVKYGIVTDNPAKIISEQGLEMGRPSFVHIEIGQANGEINFVSVGGECVAVGEGVIEID